MNTSVYEVTMERIAALVEVETMLWGAFPKYQNTVERSAALTSTISDVQEEITKLKDFLSN